MKLNDKATPYIFVGYGDEKFGYRLWNLEKQKIVKSREIVFHEHEIFKDMKKNASALELTYKDVADLTPKQTSLESALNELEMPKLEQRTKIEEPTINKKKMEMMVIHNMLSREHGPSIRYPSFENILIIDEVDLGSLQEVQSHKDSFLDKSHPRGDEFLMEE